MSPSHLRLKKNHDRRVRAGHPWIFSNEVDIAQTSLKAFSAGEEVMVFAHDSAFLGLAYVNPHSLICARIFTREPDQHLNTDFFKERFMSALQLRERLFDKPYYRLVFSEADALPGLVIDRFDRILVVQINTAGMENKKDIIIAALRETLPNSEHILLRNDSNIREHEGLTQYVESIPNPAPDNITLEENTVRFIAPLLKGQKTGWFYDHRLNRARLAAYVKGKSLLDVFSYVGGFGIQAAKFGASHVTCIETSQFACEYIHKNAELNEVAKQVDILCEDAFDAMKSLLQKKVQFDVIVVDPPAFVKKFKDKQEGLLAYQRINELAIKLLAPNGILMSCSCSMHVSMEDLVQIMQRIAYRTETQLQLLERGHQGPDHPIHPSIPETDYLKALVVRKMG